MPQRDESAGGPSSRDGQDDHLPLERLAKENAKTVNSLTKTATASLNRAVEELSGQSIAATQRSKQQQQLFETIEK